MTIADCNIYNNCATNGAGLYIHGSNDFEVTDCIFWDNYASSNGGGAYCNDANTADVISFSNCFFVENEAVSKGGGVTNIYESYGWFINCTFAENVADTYGSSMYNDIYDGGWVRVVNSIMYNDTSPGTKQHIYNTTGSIDTVAYSDVQGCGGSASWASAFGIDAGGNVDCDPEFYDSTDVDGDDEELGTYDDGLVPVELCDVIDSAEGYNATCYDIADTARIDISCQTDSGVGSCSYVDMGAYEIFAPVIFETVDVVIMCFIDESDAYFCNKNTYETDLQTFYALSRYPDFNVKIGCYVPPTSQESQDYYEDERDVIYDGADEPTGVTLEKFHEYSDREAMLKSWFTNDTAPLGIFQELWTDTVNDPDYIFLFVDNSKSMTTSTLEGVNSSEGFSGFVSWLQSEYPNAIFPGTYGEGHYEEEDDERWLKWVNEALSYEFINEN